MLGGVFFGVVHAKIANEHTVNTENNLKKVRMFAPKKARNDCRRIFRSQLQIAKALVLKVPTVMLVRADELVE
jgi:hypothetical protein